MQLSLFVNGFKNKYEIPLKGKCLINDQKILTNDVFLRIYSLLGNGDKAAALVCKAWESASITLMKNDLFVIDKFIEIFKCDLNLEEVLKVRNKATLRYSINKIKYTIANNLKLLDGKILNNLEIEAQAQFDSTVLENVFSISKIYKRLDEAFENRNKYVFYTICKDMPLVLAEWNDMDTVIKIYRKAVLNKADEVLSAVCRKMVQMGDHEKALMFLRNVFTNESARLGATIDIMKTLIQMSKADLIFDATNDFFIDENILTCREKMVEEFTLRGESKKAAFYSMIDSSK